MSLGASRRPLTVSYLMRFGIQPALVSADYHSEEGYWSYKELVPGSNLFYSEPVHEQNRQMWWTDWPDDFDYGELMYRHDLDDLHQSRRNLHDRQAS